MQRVLPVPPTMLHLSGGDVSISDLKGLKIFSKSFFFSFVYLLFSVCE